MCTSGKTSGDDRRRIFTGLLVVIPILGFAIGSCADRDSFSCEIKEIDCAVVVGEARDLQHWMARDLKSGAVSDAAESALLADALSLKQRADALDAKLATGAIDAQHETIAKEAHQLAADTDDLRTRWASLAIR